MSLAALHAYSALLLSAASKLEADAGDKQRELARIVIRLHARLNRPPRCVLLGEINSGKSSLANLLIGETVVPTSVVANSRFPIRFHYAPGTSLSAVLRDGTRNRIGWPQIGTLADLPVERIDVGLPIDRLKVFEVIDMPGTGNPAHDISSFERQRILGHIPIWCTVASRAWKQSERKEWMRLISARKALGLLVVTQADLLPDRADLAKVLTRLEKEAADDFRAIVPLAIPDALKSSAIGSKSDEPDLWASSGGAGLETELENVLAGLSEQRVLLAQRALRLAFMRRGLLSEGDGGMLQLSSDALEELIPKNSAKSERRSAWDSDADEAEMRVHHH